MLAPILAILLILFSNFHSNGVLSRLFLNDGTIVPYQPQPLLHTKKDIYIFIHICTDGLYWREILQSQLKCIIDAGLYAECKQIFYGCSCTNCKSILADFFRDYTKVFPLEGALSGRFENMTLNKMVDFCQDHEGFCLYIHTKGSTGRSIHQHAWRDYMMYWLVTKYAMSLDLLERGFFTTGVLYQKIPLHLWGYERLYSGNFFWVRSDYMKSLPQIKNMNDRFEAEKILFKKYQKGKHISLTTDSYFSGYIPWKMGLYNNAIQKRTQSNFIVII